MTQQIKDVLSLGFYRNTICPKYIYIYIILCVCKMIIQSKIVLFVALPHGEIYSLLHLPFNCNNHPHCLDFISLLSPTKLSLQGVLGTPAFWQDSDLAGKDSIILTTPNAPSPPPLPSPSSPVFIFCFCSGSCITGVAFSWCFWHLCLKETCIYSIYI